MADPFERLRAVGAGARLPTSADVRHRGDQRTARTRLVVASAAVVLVGTVGGALAVGSGASHSLQPVPLASVGESSTPSSTPSSPAASTQPTQEVTGPDFVAWWRSQTLPTGWESPHTVTFEDGTAISCTEQLCDYSMPAVHVQPGTRATATVLLFRRDSSGWRQTLLVLSAAPGGVTLLSASDTAVVLPEARSACSVSLRRSANGDVEQTFSGCSDGVGNGVQWWRLTGARLAPE